MTRMKEVHRRLFGHINEADEDQFSRWIQERRMKKLRGRGGMRKLWLDEIDENTQREVKSLQSKRQMHKVVDGWNGKKVMEKYNGASLLSLIFIVYYFLFFFSEESITLLNLKGNGTNICIAHRLPHRL